MHKSREAREQFLMNVSSTEELIDERDAKTNSCRTGRPIDSTTILSNENRKATAGPQNESKRSKANELV